jgi:glycine/D-amino acid oxidase-like deaminating enzyme
VSTDVRAPAGDWQTRSFWLSRRPYQPCPPLDGSIVVDVVIVGSGFTGLWSAIELKEADPSIEVAVVEAKVAGYGASGRNAGFAMTMVGRSLHDLVQKVGPAQARATHRAMRQVLGDIDRFCETEQIDAEVSAPGLLTVSNGPEQDQRVRDDLAAAGSLGLDDFHELSGAECRALLRCDRFRLGHFEDDSLLVDPAALARGLRDAAIRRGVRIYEQTPVLSFDERHRQGVLARTPFGSVHADRGLIATNAYAWSVPALRRFIFTVRSYVILTEPLSDAQWERIGWERRMGVEDKRIMPHFFRPTPDGRILWGGRDAPISAVGPNPRHDRDSAVFARLEETFRWSFPQLSDLRVVEGWGGPVCGTLRCIGSVGFLGRSERLGYALGYAGHGVGQSRLAARCVRDLFLGAGGEVLELPLVAKRPLPLPPRPIGTAVLGFSQQILQRVDDGERPGLAARMALRVLDGHRPVLTPSEPS